MICCTDFLIFRLLIGDGITVENSMPCEEGRVLPTATELPGCAMALLVLQPSHSLRGFVPVVSVLLSPPGLASVAVIACVTASLQSPLWLKWKAGVEGWCSSSLRSLCGNLSWRRSARGPGRGGVISLTFKKCVLALVHPQYGHFPAIAIVSIPSSLRPLSSRSAATSKRLGR